MSYQNDRDSFVARMAAEGLSLFLTHKLLRAATSLQRYAELACSSEAADRDRVPCPAKKSGKDADCVCDQYDGTHNETVPRIAVLEARTIKQLTAAMPAGWAINTQGDPRGYRVIPPSYAERNAGRDYFNLDAIGVPSGRTGLRF